VGGDEVVGPKADLAITNTNNVSSVNRGQAVTYTVVVTNNGPTAVTGAVVTDTRPTALTSWTWSCAPVANCGGSNASNSNQSSNVNKTLATLASGASVTFTMTATVPNGATIGGALVNAAAVAAPAGISDTNLANNNVTDTDLIVALVAATVTGNGTVGSPVDFGTEARGGAAGQTKTVMTITNPNGVSITLGFTTSVNAPSTGTFANNWQRNTVVTNNCGSSLAAGATCNIAYTFDPRTGGSNTAGQKTATVTATTTTPGVTTPIGTTVMTGNANP
jgi:uncharacterized repeat protein (TIGR01451 family)